MSDMTDDRPLPSLGYDPFHSPLIDCKLTVIGGHPTIPAVCTVLLHQGCNDARSQQSLVINETHRLEIKLCFEFVLFEVIALLA
jgi:hypothetical protein